MLKLNRNSIARSIAQAFRMTDRKAKTLVDILFEEIQKGIIETGDFKAHSFGRWNVTVRAPKKVQIRKDGSLRTAQLPARKAVRFIPSPKLKDLMNKYAQWEGHLKEFVDGENWVDCITELENRKFEI